MTKTYHLQVTEETNGMGQKEKFRWYMKVRPRLPPTWKSWAGLGSITCLLVCTKTGPGSQAWHTSKLRLEFDSVDNLLAYLCLLWHPPVYSKAGIGGRPGQARLWHRQTPERARPGNSPCWAKLQYPLANVRIRAGPQHPL